jgi:hypothetical protein
MSSKLVIEESSVYLYIEDLSECCFELWEVDGQKDSAVKVRIPIDDWKRMVKRWKKAEKDKK